MKASMILREQRFDLVVTRGDGTSISRGNSRYFRIGPVGILDSEIAIPRRMLDAGFLVAEIIEIREQQGLRFLDRPA